MIAPVCDAALDRASTLVTRGAPHLSVRDHRDRAAPSKPSTTENVRFDLTAIGCAVPPGRRTPPLSLPLFLLPALDLARAGPGDRLHLHPSASSLERTLQAGEFDPAITRSRPPPLRHPCPSGRPRPHGGRAGAYSVREAGPLSTRARSSRSIRPRRPGPAWDARGESRSEVTCDTRDFTLQRAGPARAATRWPPSDAEAADPTRRGPKPRRPPRRPRGTERGPVNP